MSRKYHKLVVVPTKTTPSQLYRIQQRLLAVVNRKLATQTSSSSSLSSSSSSSSSLSLSSSAAATAAAAAAAAATAAAQNRAPYRARMLPAAYLIVEQRPLAVNCNISDEFVLRQLRIYHSFQLSWYKNGRLLRGSFVGPVLTQSAQNQTNASTSSNIGQQQQQHQTNARLHMQINAKLPSFGNQRQVSGSNLEQSLQRIQFRSSNGRQLFISSAQQSDAGDYVCSWAKLRQFVADNVEGLQQMSANEARTSLNSYSSNNNAFDSASTTNSNAQLNSNPNPLESGQFYQFQLMIPVKLRPFKSSYAVREGNELRIACQAQFGYPAPAISWFVGNRLVDEQFANEQNGKIQVLTYSGIGLFNSVLAVTNDSSELIQSQEFSSSLQQSNTNKLIVEINPVPASKHLLSQTTNSGAWLEYKDAKNEKNSLDSQEKRRQYVKTKLFVLANSVSGHQTFKKTPNQVAGTFENSDNIPLQASVSILVINSLIADKHSSRFACRATNRVNTDEVTTVIKVQSKSFSYFFILLSFSRLNIR